jgi:DNA (cytosine-5)-methyltransferase 1
VNGKLEWQVGPIKPNDSIFNYFIQIRQSGIRVKKAEYFPTLVAMTQTPIYGKEKRHITPRECARLQSFPNTFILPHEMLEKIESEDKHFRKPPLPDQVAYKQLGNSVNVDNVHTIISKTLSLYCYK